jgi:hypothetical protein
VTVGLSRRTSSRRCAAWLEYDGDLPVLEGTLIRLVVGHLPGDGDPKPLWLWSSSVGASPSHVDRLGRRSCAGLIFSTRSGSSSRRRRGRTPARDRGPDPTADRGTGCCRRRRRRSVATAAVRRPCEAMPLARDPPAPHTRRSGPGTPVPSPRSRRSSTHSGGSAPHSLSMASRGWKQPARPSARRHQATKSSDVLEAAGIHLLGAPTGDRLSGGSCCGQAPPSRARGVSSLTSVPGYVAQQGAISSSRSLFNIINLGHCHKLGGGRDGPR